MYNKISPILRFFVRVLFISALLLYYPYYIKEIDSKVSSARSSTFEDISSISLRTPIFRPSSFDPFVNVQVSYWQNSAFFRTFVSGEPLPPLTGENYLKYARNLVAVGEFQKEKGLLQDKFEIIKSPSTLKRLLDYLQKTYAAPAETLLHQGQFWRSRYVIKQYYDRISGIHFETNLDLNYERRAPIAKAYLYYLVLDEPEGFLRHADEVKRISEIIQRVGGHNYLISHGQKYEAFQYLNFKLIFAYIQGQSFLQTKNYASAFATFSKILNELVAMDLTHWKVVFGNLTELQLFRVLFWYAVDHGIVGGKCALNKSFQTKFLNDISSFIKEYYAGKNENMLWFDKIETLKSLVPSNHRFYADMSFYVDKMVGACKK